MKKTDTNQHWHTIDKLNQEDLSVIGLDQEELKRSAYLAEHPELYNFILACLCLTDGSVPSVIVDQPFEWLTDI